MKWIKLEATRRQPHPHPHPHFRHTSACLTWPKERWRESFNQDEPCNCIFITFKQPPRQFVNWKRERELPPLLSVAVEGLQLRRKFIIKGVKTFNMFNFAPIFLPAPLATPSPFFPCASSVHLTSLGQHRRRFASLPPKKRKKNINEIIKIYVIKKRTETRTAHKKVLKTQLGMAAALEMLRHFWIILTQIKNDVNS